jgi:hypothetical protein
MEQQAEPGQPFLEIDQHPPCISHFLAAHDEVVGVADDHYIASRHLLSPCFHPLVERVVQVDVRQQG